MKSALLQLPPDGVLRTNPVYVLQTFGQEVIGGVRSLLSDFEDMQLSLSVAARRYAAEMGLFPQPPLDEQPDAPGVVGLLYWHPSSTGFVTPLVARLSGEWEVASNLPFRPSDLRNALARLLRAAGTEAADLATEFFAFDLRDCAGMEAEGSSMTVTGLLASLVAVAGDPDGLFAPPAPLSNLPRMASCVRSTEP